MSWQDKLRNPDCELCPLHESAEWVCLMGTGSKKSKVMVIGEAPGHREDEEHAAFVGPSGQLLRDTLEAVGIPAKDCYISNVNKCRPPDNRAPTRTEAKICSAAYLDPELEAVDPDFVLLLGNAPLQALVGRSGITKYRGQVFGEEPLLFPTFHPAYVLRSPQHAPTFRSDLERFARMVRGQASKAEATSVRMVQGVSGLKWLRRQLQQAEVISYDIETWTDPVASKHKEKNLQEWHGEHSKICSISFSWEVGQAVVVPLHHQDSPWRNPDAVLRALKPGLERRDAKYVAHNGKFDCRWLAAKGIFVPQTFDTMLAAHLLNENRSKGLKPLSQILLGVDAYDLDVDLSDAYHSDLRKLCLYNGKDTDYTLRLYNIFREELKSQPRLGRIMARLMMPASNLLTEVEMGGMYLDQANLEKQFEALETAKLVLDKKMRKRVKAHKRAAINFNSYPQVGEWLFKDLGLNPLKLTGTGNPSTDESVLLQLEAQGSKEAKLLLKHRGLVKNLGYLKGWRERTDARSRVHTTYKLFGTVTGRLSSEKPNLQQVPREGPMRTCYGAPPGYVFLESDYSQVELRVAAMLAHEDTLLRIFATGGDPHLTTAANISGLTPQQVLESDASGETEHRKKAKPVNFGFLYGMGEAKFIEYARDNYGVVVTEEEAHEYRERYFRLYPKLIQWHNRQRRLVQQYGQVHSPIGRVRHLPDVRSGDYKVVAEAERQAINSPVQSFASDLMLLSAVRLRSRLRPAEARMVGTVHDALLFEIRESAVEKYAGLIRTVMEGMSVVEKVFGARMTIPIVVEIKVGTHWGAGKVYEAA